MAAAVDFSALTLNVEEARSTSELVFESLFKKPSLSEIHAVMTGVDMDKYIPILGKLGAVGKLSSGDCTNNDVAGIPVSQKQWIIKLITWRLVHCQEAQPDLLKFWKKSAIAANLWAEVDSDEVAFVQDRALDATYESILRITSFADTAATTFGTGSGSNNLTAGTDIGLFTMLDGLWKQVFTDQAGSGLIHRYTIPENALASYSAQLALAADRAKLVFTDLYENIDPEAMANDVKIQCTSTLFRNYLTYLETQSIAFTLERLENGTKTVKFRDIMIVERPDWDRNIKTFFDNGTTYDFPHRAIITYNENIPIGTSDTQSLSTLKSHYNETDEKHYLKSAFRIGVVILQEGHIGVAY